jgi:hypothetical protein
MHRYAPKCSPQALEKRLLTHVLNCPKSELVRRRFHYLSTDHQDYALLAMEALLRKDPQAFPEVISDWSRVTTTLNEISTGEMIEEVPELKGTFQLDNGVSVIGMDLGFAEHHPVFAVIYHDGYEFRGYIPDRGNVYNRDRHAAFGLAPQEDAKAYVRDHGQAKGVTDETIAAQKLAGGYFYPLGFSASEILEDLNGNIRAMNAVAA